MQDWKAIMWKPGAPRPGGGGSSSGPATSPGPGQQQPNSKSPAAPAAKGKEPSSAEGSRKLSTGTMHLKFMQKKAAKEQQIQEDKEKSKAEDAARWRVKGAKEAIEESTQSQGVKFEVEETDPKTQWIGRRSYGGFNPIVQKMWEQNCEKAGLFKQRKRRSEEITDEEMVERFTDMGKGPGRGGGGGKRGRYTDLGVEDRKGGGGHRQGHGQGQGQHRGGQGQGRGGQGQGKGNRR